MEDWVYWLALKDVNGLGDVLIRRLVSKFNSPKDVFSASKSEILGVEGVGETVVQKIKTYSDWEKVGKEVSKLKNLGFRLLSFQNNEYPSNLENIFNPPTLLYISGNIIESDKCALAVVGSRDCDEYGRGATEKFVRELSERGITIVSGMARGIDTVAHRSSLEKSCRTLAVLGNGLDIVYPHENMRLYERVAENGALISEFNLGTAPDSGNFPRRNRLLSGLSLGVLVIQASRKSGALITASYASEQNREVFSVPGNVNNNRSNGSNWLIKKGAKLVDCVEDILEEIDAFRNLVSDVSNERKVSFDHNLSEEERRIIGLFEDKQLHVDEIIVKSKLDVQDVLRILLDMELKGVIKQLPGKMFRAL